MADSDTTRRATYHHGNLRAALLEAAEAELAEKGSEGFTLRSCAKRAGVSHAAPAHHFTDMSGLLTALATDGFERFLRALRTSVASAENASAQDRLVAAGLGYIAFARQNPALFRLMFASDRPDFSQPELTSAAAAAFQDLVDSVGEASGDEKPMENPRGRRDVARLWGLVHGLADLLLSGHLKTLAGQGENHLQAELRAILGGDRQERD